MTRAALESLLAKVEAGRVGQFENLDSHFGHGNGIHAKRAFHGSLDAAKALHEAVLPGWFPGLSQNIHSEMWLAWVQDKSNCHLSFAMSCPARAWLIAIIRAMLAEGE